MRRCCRTTATLGHSRLLFIRSARVAEPAWPVVELAVVLAGAAVAAHRETMARPAPPFMPTAAYLRVEVEGWTVYISPALLGDSELGSEALRALQW